MTRKKHSNPILDNPDNGGIHSTRRLKSVHTMMTTHGLKNAVVYEFILAGKADKAEYQATIKALVRHIRTQCRAEYVGAYEIGDEKGGLHCHCYIVIETAPQIPRYLLDVTPGHWIARRIARTGMSIKIAPPKAPMHGGAMFAKMDTPAKLADVIAWVEYHVKGRSKDGVPGREVYFASEFASNAVKREAKRQKYRDALEKSSRPAAPAATNPSPSVDPSTGKANHTITEKEAQHEGSTTTGNRPESSSQGEAGNSHPNGRKPSQGHSSPYTSTGQPGMGEARQGPRVPASSTNTSTEAQAIRLGQADGGTDCQEHDTRPPITHSPGGTMLTAAEKFVAAKYEAGVDAQLDLDAMRRFLLAHGIKRTPAAVVFDLDERYGFHGYAASHPASLVDVRAYDRTTSRKDWTNPIERLATTSEAGSRPGRLTSQCRPLRSLSRN